MFNSFKMGTKVQIFFKLIKKEKKPPGESGFFNDL